MKSFLDKLINFDTCEEKKYYYIVYSIFFIVLIPLVFSQIIFQGRSFVHLGDGWDQHYRALVYYGRYLRDTVRALLIEHRLIIQDWDFHIGEGSDVLNTLHYYVIGDPIAFLSVFVPTRYMHYFFTFSVIFRIYLAGIAFSILAFDTSKHNKYGILAGALTYSFCYWAILNTCNHPYFLNPLIYFPFIILGIEKILRGCSPCVYILSVFISAISNFYFFYMIVIMTIIYAVIRVALIYKKEMQKAAAYLIKLAFYAFIGVSMAGIVFIPVIMMALQDSRMAFSQPFHLFWPLNYYSSIPAMLISCKEPDRLRGGFSAVSIIALFYLISEKGTNKLLKILFAVCAVITVFPVLGKVFNGMSYITNRWSWILALLMAYNLTDMWEKIFNMNRKEFIRVTVTVIVYSILCFSCRYSMDSSVYSALLFLFSTLIVVEKKDFFSGMKNTLVEDRLRQITVMALMCLSIINIAYWKFSPLGENYAGGLIENVNILEKLNSSDAKAISNYTNGQEIRYSGRQISVNQNLLEKTSNTQYYWTLSNPYINNYRLDLEMNSDSAYKFSGYDDRTVPTTLSSVKYYIAPTNDTKGMPYGYEYKDHLNIKEKLRLKYIMALEHELGKSPSEEQLTKTEDEISAEYSIFENNYALPLGYCYSSFLPKELWDSLDPVQKQEVQLDAVYLDKEEADLNIKSFQQEIPKYDISYNIECIGSEIIKTEEGFITTADNTQILLEFNGLDESETYIELKGLDFKGTSDYDLYLGDESVDPKNIYNKTGWDTISVSDRNKIKNEKKYHDYREEVYILIESDVGNSLIEYRTPDSPMTWGRHDFIGNLGYSETGCDSVRIIFPKAGKYKLEKIKVYCVPMVSYPQRISTLKENALENIHYDTDVVTGSITLEEPKILVMSIPYSKGWKAYIDGSQVPVMIANERHLGIELNAGIHKLTFIYSTPYRKIGFIISLVGSVMMLLVSRFFYKKPQNKS